MENNLYSLKTASGFTQLQSKCKLLFCVLLGMGISFFSSAQTPGQWVWLGGDSTTNSAGNFGTQGIASLTNQPPALGAMGKWTDKNGNFWFYGGVDDNNGVVHNDLWKYNPVTHEWTWMTGTGIGNDAGDYGTQGVELPSNRPPCRHDFTTWVDSSGNFWMFGGMSGWYTYSDLWKYDVTANEWTWIKGPNTYGDIGSFGIQGVPDSSNNPQCSYEGSGWTDNAGDLWLFGFTFNSSLWRYNIATNTWTWMKGSNYTGPYLSSELPVYGKEGVEDSANNPGIRSNFWSWNDNNGNFWLFGGFVNILGGFIINTKNDLWRFNPVNGNWTWMNGDSSNSASSSFNIYGTKCISNPGNMSVGRDNNGGASWTDTDGNLWMFGGLGGGTYAQPGGLFNDLWMYCIIANQWTWKGGDNCNRYITPDSAEAAPGSWGVLGVSSAANKPGARISSVGWADNNGHLYLFGGIGLNYVVYNDLWSFTIDSGCAPCRPPAPISSFKSDNSYICTNSCINFTDLSSYATSWHWNFPWATPASSSAQNPQNICYPLVGNYDVTLITGNPYGSDTLTYTYYITVHPAPTVPAISQNGDTLLSSTSYTYQWYLNSSLITGATNQVYIASQNGSYSVSITDSDGCSATSSPVNITTVGITDLKSDYSFLIYPNPAGSSLNIYFNKNIKDGIINIYNVMGEKVVSRAFNGGAYSLSFGEGRGEVFPAGIYLLQVTDVSGSRVKKFVKE